MHQVNARGTFVVSKWAIPISKGGKSAHFKISPPLDMKEKWFAPYTRLRWLFGMSPVVLGLAGELRPKGTAVNALCHAQIATCGAEPARR
jgi:citronellol/citronellal dehydrogenase